MKREMLYLLFEIFLMTVISGCSLGMVKGLEHGNKHCEKRILIATQQSEFKEVVVSRVLDGLLHDACYIKVMDLKKIAGESTERYQAIVIMNTCWVWRLNRHARNFLKDAREKERIILLTTANDEAWKPKKVEVDAITSASKMDKADSVAKHIIEKVRSLLAKGILS